MDDRLEKALEFANYRITLSNQKRTIRQRMHVLQTVNYNRGVFHANPTTIMGSAFFSLIALTIAFFKEVVKGSAVSF